MISMHCHNTRRWSNQAGIAIGPILFIIAILGILAAAIAAGSGSFTATTAGDSNKTKASGLIEVGENLKIGMDRLTVEVGGTPSGNSQWSLDPTNTNGAYSLFSPGGGGIAPPSASLAGAPNADVWHYFKGTWPGLGGSGSDYFAVLNVSGDVCNEINNKAGVLSNVAASLLNNDIFAGEPPAGVETNIADIVNVPSQLSGKTLGCFGDKTSAKYYFYEVLYVQ